MLLTPLEILDGKLGLMGLLLLHGGAASVDIIKSKLILSYWCIRIPNGTSPGALVYGDLQPLEITLQHNTGHWPRLVKLKFSPPRVFLLAII